MDDDDVITLGHPIALPILIIINNIIIPKKITSSFLFLLYNSMRTHCAELLKCILTANIKKLKTVMGKLCFWDMMIWYDDVPNKMLNVFLNVVSLCSVSSSVFTIYNFTTTPVPPKLCLPCRDTRYTVFSLMWTSKISRSLFCMDSILI